MDKQAARQAGLQARKALSSRERKAMSMAIVQKLLPYLDDISCIGVYLPMREEVDIDPLIQTCYAKGIHVYAPVVRKGTLIFHQITSNTVYATSRFGVQEPVDTPIKPVEEMDLFIVPLSSFDSQCHRTGYGKGYYDSVLNRARHKIGVAYSVQQMAEIDVEPHDVTLDGIVTEKGSIFVKPW
ncbi:MAG: 5-formyltetrahydrofolate cyclo-ligase [Lactimicrobium sp.]|uniref:5-formyltetrahydrofolate cyclo-ligase n=1 Tax=Lactimicrobium sp. TaxID=2563780 RepID=UPI002F35EFDE